jgi:hypothetical protein
MKSGKTSQNVKEELRKAQKHKKLTNLKTPPKSTPLTLSLQTQPLR